MKSKKTIRNIIIVFLLLAVSTAVLFVANDYFASYQYVKSCYYENTDAFEQIMVCFKNMYSENISNIKLDDESLFNTAVSIQAKETLDNLRKQYQKDNEYLVFSYVDAYYDKDGNMLLYIQAKKERLKSGDGMNSPDIRCYYLIYIDECYDGKSPIKEKKPFKDNWYTWSSDIYSG